MANAAFAGVINMIPGAQAASTGLQHDAYGAWAEAGVAQHHLDVVRNNAMAYGWW